MVEFSKGRPLADPTIIQRFEEEQGVVLPDDYRSVVLQNDGAFPKPSRLPVNDPKHGIQYYSCGRLLSYENTDSIFLMNDGETAGVIAGLIAFGVSGTGVLFCFDYRADPLNPSIVVVTGEEDVEPIPVASSFTELMAALVTSPFPHP